MSRTQPLRLTNPLICNHNDKNGIFIVQTQRVEPLFRVLDFHFQIAWGQTRYTKSCGHRFWSTYTFESDVLLLIRTWSQESDKSELVIRTDLQEQVVAGWSILFHSTVESELMMVFRGRLLKKSFVWKLKLALPIQISRWLSEIAFSI